MTGNNNTYYKSSMYENRGENTAQEIIIALAIAVISLLLAGVIISHFSGSLSSGSYYGSGNSSGIGGFSNNDGSSGGGYVGDGTEDTEDYDDTDYDDADDTDDGENTYDDDSESSDDSESDEAYELYTDNWSMNISDCLSVDDYYQRDSADGSFSFAYPKYVFNDADINEEENYYDYYYEDDNGNRTIEMKFYSEDDPGDAVQNAKELFYSISGEPSEVLYQVEPKDQVGADGMARGIVAGTYDDEGTCVYIVAANDGQKDYIMELYYPDSAPEYDYDDVNYIIDCVYRYCSFAGGTYKPRSHELFMRDDMGEKK